jgi:CBS domain-containing protein
MKVKKLFNKKKHAATTIAPEVTVYDALKLMAKKEVGALVVLEDDKMVGIFSERDYARKVILKGKNSKETMVREIMTTDILHTSPNKKLGKCLSLMTKNRFRHMPVLENGRLIGILSMEDVKSIL